MRFLDRTKFSSFFRSVGKNFFSKQALFVSGLILLSIYINFIFIFHPLKGKKWLSKIYNKPLQQTLNRVDGLLIENDMDVRILKVKRGNKIHLEFLSKQANDAYVMIGSVELKGSREGYFEYQGEMASLLLEDDEGDGPIDVIAPTFDRFFRPQRNIVFYNQKTKQFELKPPSDYPKVIIRSDSRPY